MMPEKWGGENERRLSYKTLIFYLLLSSSSLAGGLSGQRETDPFVKKMALRWGLFTV